MKKAWLILAGALVATLAFAEDIEKKSSFQELPERAQSFINTYFEGVKIKKGTKTIDECTFVE